jgi:hypothetical protein
MLHFEIPAAHSVHIPADEAQGFPPCRPPRAWCHIRPQNENNGLQDSPRASCPCGKGGDGREEPTSQLHTCLEGNMSEEIRECSSGEAELWVGTTRLVVVGLAAAVSTLVAAFFFGFTAAGLVAAVGFG